jgi:hypothetical protein
MRIAIPLLLTVAGCTTLSHQASQAPGGGESTKRSEDQEGGVVGSATHPLPELPDLSVKLSREAALAPPDPMVVIHDELGPTVPIIREDPFLVAGPGWTLASLHTVTDLVHRALDALYNGRFTTHPARPVAVYLFSSKAPYEQFCQSRFHEECMSPFGFYRPDVRTIVMNAGPGIGTLTHEIIHPLVEADFKDAPTWIDEGIAALYEAPVLPREGEIHGAKNWRLPRLVAALGPRKGQPAARLDALFGMTDAAFRDGDEPLHYAMARYACQWLDQRGKLWAFYRAWRDTRDTDPTGERAFAAVVGQTPAEANDAWQAWVKRL